jgi:predicted nucleic acid-binding protein
MTLDRLAVDSSAAVDYFDPTRHTPPAIDQADELVLPLPVLGELRFGALNASAEWRPRMLETLDAFVERCEVLLPDLQTADVYARVRASIRFPVTMSRRREEIPFARRNEIKRRFSEKGKRENSGFFSSAAAADAAADIRKSAPRTGAVKGALRAPRSGL